MRVGDGLAETGQNKASTIRLHGQDEGDSILQQVG